MKTKRLEVLFLINDLELSGAEKIFFELVKRFKASLALEIRIVTLLPGASFFGDKLERLGFKIESLGETRKSGFFKARRKLIEIVLDFKPDIIQTFLEESDLLSRTISKKHDFVLINSLQNDPRLVWHYQVLNRMTKSRVDAYVALSKNQAKLIEKHIGISNKKIRVIENGIDLEGCYNAKGDQKKLKAELGIASSSKLLLYVANLRPEKGHRILFQALAKLNGKNNLDLLLAGEGDLVTELKLEAKELGIQNRIHFMGTRNDIFELMKSVDVCLLPSKSEGLSLVLLEYLATGSAIVASDISGNKEVIRDGENGLLFKNGSSDDLALKIDELLQDGDLRLKLSKKALETAKEYDIEKMAKKYLSLYQSYECKV